MTDDRVEWHLWNWSTRACSNTFNDGGYGSRASGGIGHSWSNDSDSMVAEVDTRCAYIVDVLIGELPEIERCAVRHVHLEAVYRFRDGHKEPYRRAKMSIGRGLDKRGIL